MTSKQAQRELDNFNAARKAVEAADLARNTLEDSGADIDGPEFAAATAVLHAAEAALQALHTAALKARPAPLISHRKWR
jgi:hypothetical protein